MAELKKIGQYTITDADVNAFVQALPREQQMYAQVPEFRAQILERLEEITLFSLYGAEQKLDESEEYKEIMSRIKRDTLGQMTLQVMMKDVTVTPEEAKEFFEANKSRFVRPAKANASHILVDSEELAQEILGKLEAGAVTFEDAAKEYSTCPSGKEGGNLGDFEPGQMVAEFNDAVFTGELGKILGPVKTQFGYHLILINSRVESCNPEYDDVKAQVEKQVLSKKQQELYVSKLAELKAKYEA